MKYLHVIPRKSAQALGLKRYFTAKPCPKGHVDERQTATGSCFGCKAAIDKTRERDPEYMRQYLAQYRRDNLDKFEVYKERARAKPGYMQKVYAHTVEYRKRMRESVLANQRRYRNQRYASDPAYRCAILLRCMLRRTPSRKVAYGAQDLVKRMECQFKPGMSWDNYGEWEIDHKKPIAAFLKQGKTDARLIHALANLQPLWSAENRSKSDYFKGVSTRLGRRAIPAAPL